MVGGDVRQNPLVKSTQTRRLLTTSDEEESLRTLVRRVYFIVSCCWLLGRRGHRARFQKFAWPSSCFGVVLCSLIGDTRLNL